MLANDGNFYGTTLLGGNAKANCPDTNGCGTIYRMTASGVETLLYSFGMTATDGAGPSGSLLQASDGNLYGKTFQGGPTNLGTLFKLPMSAN